MSITTQVFILFILVLAGAACRRLGYFTDECIRGMTQMVLNIALPCMTIANMQRPFSADILVNFAVALGLSCGIILVSMLVGAALFRRKARARRAVLINLTGFSNCGFMGYPIILAVNPDWMIYAVAYNIAYNLLAWTLGVSLYGGKDGASLRRALLNPNLFAAVIGVALFCLRVTIPDIPYQAMTLLGGLTTPLSMLIIGTRIVGLKLRAFRDADYHIVGALRLVVLPLALFAALRFLPVAPEVAGSLYLLTAMPSASLTAMQSEIYGGDATFAARAIAYTTLLSLVTVPVMSLLL